MDNAEFRKKATSRITIQERQEEADEYGGQVVSWIDRHMAWALIIPKSGSEILQSGQLVSIVRHEIIIRYIDGGILSEDGTGLVTETGEGLSLESAFKISTEGAKHRVEFSGRYFDILAVMGLDRSMTREGKAFQKLICVDK